MSKYRSHNCNALRKKDVGNDVLLSGWINKKRDHGNLLFIDLRDNYGITQCIIDKKNPKFNDLEKIQLETVIKIDGKVIDRLMIDGGIADVSSESVTIMAERAIDLGTADAAVLKESAATANEAEADFLNAVIAAL